MDFGKNRNFSLKAAQHLISFLVCIHSFSVHAMTEPITPAMPAANIKGYARVFLCQVAMNDKTSPNSQPQGIAKISTNDLKWKNVFIAGGATETPQGVSEFSQISLTNQRVYEEIVGKCGPMIAACEKQKRALGMQGVSKNCDVHMKMLSCRGSMASLMMTQIQEPTAAMNPNLAHKMVESCSDIDIMPSVRKISQTGSENPTGGQFNRKVIAEYKRLYGELEQGFASSSPMSLPTMPVASEPSAARSQAIIQTAADASAP